MTTAQAVGAVSSEAAEWYAIDWQAIHRNVRDRKSTRLNSSHSQISYAVFCLKKEKREPRRASGDRAAGANHGGRREMGAGSARDTGQPRSLPRLDHWCAARIRASRRGTSTGP